MNSDMSIYGLRPLSDSREILMDFRFQSPLSASAAGLINPVFSLRDPARAINGAGTYSDIANISNVFDQYKVQKWCLEYTPVPAINSFSLPPLYLCADFDDNDSTALTTYDQANQYNNRLIWDTRYANSFCVDVPDLNSGITAGGTPAIIHENGFFDFANPPINGVVYAVGSGFAPSLLLGQLSLTMRLKVKFQR